MCGPANIQDDGYIHSSPVHAGDKFIGGNEFCFGVRVEDGETRIAAYVAAAVFLYLHLWL